MRIRILFTFMRIRIPIFTFSESGSDFRFIADPDPAPHKVKRIRDHWSIYPRPPRLDLSLTILVIILGQRLLHFEPLHLLNFDFLLIRIQRSLNIDPDLVSLNNADLHES